MVFIVNRRSGTRKDHRSSAFVPGNVPLFLSRISWPISVNGGRSMQGEVAYSYCARNGCLRNIRNAATDGHSISGKLVTRAYTRYRHSSKRSVYTFRGSRFTLDRDSSAIVYIRALYIVGTSIIGPLMAVLLPRFETRVVLRTFFASNACTTCMDYFAFRAVTRVQAYRLNLPARVETRLRPWLFRPENVYFLSSLLAVPNITVLYSL